MEGMNWYFDDDKKGKVAKGSFIRKKFEEKEIDGSCEESTKKKIKRCENSIKDKKYEKKNFKKLAKKINKIEEKIDQMYNMIFDSIAKMFDSRFNQIVNLINKKNNSWPMKSYNCVKRTSAFPNKIRVKKVEVVGEPQPEKTHEEKADETNNAIDNDFIKIIKGPKNESDINAITLNDIINYDEYKKKYRVSSEITTKFWVEFMMIHSSIFNEEFQKISDKINIDSDKFSEVLSNALDKYFGSKFKVARKHNRYIRFSDLRNVVDMVNLIKAYCYIARISNGIDVYNTDERVKNYINHLMHVLVVDTIDNIINEYVPYPPESRKKICDEILNRIFI